MEAALECKLFERLPGGYALTEAGSALVADAESIESLTYGIQSRLAGRGRDLSGSVRIGSPEGFGTYILAPALSRLARLHPALEFEIVASPQVASLSRREADIIITSALPLERKLAVQKLTDFELGLYAAVSYIQTRGRPAKLEDLTTYGLVGYVDDLMPTREHRYFDELLPLVGPNVRISNILTQIAAVIGGAGAGILPLFMAEGAVGLERLLPETIRLRRSYWCVTHQDLRNLARVRVISAFIAQIVAERRFQMSD
jgi:DNA-binding transcriptional LysR family regulator